MYQIDLNYDYYVYPWDCMVLTSRINALFAKNKKIIVYLYEQADYGTFRYRIYNMCELLNYSNEYSATFFSLNELEVVLQYIDRIDYIVMVRSRWSFQLENLFIKASAKKIPLIFDVDDFIFDVTKIPLLMHSINTEKDEHAMNYWFAYGSRIHATAKNCNSYLTTNSFLAEKISDFLQKKTCVIPNFMNIDQLNVSNIIYDLKKKLRKQDQFLIGYFSGTNSHSQDFALVSTALAKLMHCYPNVRLRIVGFLDIPECLLEFQAVGRIESIKLQNYLNLQVKIAECDLNLIPLLINEFTNSKSELKFFEAAIVGVQSIASPTYIYKEVIIDGENGYLARQEGWYSKIEGAMQENTQLIHSARDYAEKNYFGKKILSILQNVFV